jgi:hypothetical protein
LGDGEHVFAVEMEAKTGEAHVADGLHLFALKGTEITGQHAHDA